MKRMATEQDLKALVRSKLDGTAAGKANLAHELGITVGQLSNLLRRPRSIGDKVAGRLGYRRRVVFEPLEAPAPE